MKRFLTFLALFATLANSASAGLVITGSKAAAGTGFASGYDSIKFNLTGFTGSDLNTAPAEITTGPNAVVSIKGTFSVTGGTMYFPQEFDGSGDGVSGDPDQQYQNTLNAKSSNGNNTNSRLATPFSFVNMDQATTNPTVAVPGAPYTGPALTSFNAEWFTQGNNLSGSAGTRTALTPFDTLVNNFDQTLFARIYATPGSVITFNGVYASYSAGIDQPVTFSFNNGAVVSNDPIQVTSTPVSGTSRTVGETVQIANAAQGVNPRDAATLSGLSVTSNLGTFSQTGLSNGSIAAGSSQTGTIGFSGAGLLNGAQATGTLSFNIASGPNGAGTGAGAYSYPLTATVSGNSGDGSAPVGAGGSLAGLSSTSGLVNGGGSVHLPSTATILAGVNAGDAETVSMTWSLRALNEQRPGFSNPPLPKFASALTSDKVDLTGTDGDVFVLQMTYAESELLNSEATDAADGQLFLASFNTATNTWVNAIDLNHGSNVGATNVQGGWATAGGSTLALGAWGVDIQNNVVWAVLDHNSLFASVPEPSTIILGLMGLVGLVGFARRRRS